MMRAPGLRNVKRSPDGAQRNPGFSTQHNSPSGLFNSSLEGNIRRAIDLHQGETIDEKALQALIRAAVALNASVKRRSA